MNKIQIEKVIMRFVGDSGDGIQLMGNQISETSVITSGNDIYTFVEFPPEIRAPAGSISGISGFQLSISSKKLYSIDDNVDLLVTFNPAALKTSISYLKTDGLLIIDLDSFNDKNLKRAGFDINPLIDNSLNKYKIIKIPITKLTYECVKDNIPSVSNAKRCKNFFALGLICWIYDRNIETIKNWINKKFKDVNILEGNKKALIAGFNYGSTIEILHSQFHIPAFKKENNSENLIKISGSKAFTLGALASSIILDLPIFSANYPITPASDILHEISLYINDKFKVCQLEDEIAAINAIIGASYGGALAFTCTSGPGLDLMQEGIGLAIMSQLPIVILNIQRSGPSTGIPTRSEQTDLLASMFGRHGESEVIILAPNSPSDCFYSIIEGFYLSIVSLSPVIILSDANLANSSELWKTPSIDEIKEKTNIKLDDVIKKYSQNNNESITHYWINPGIKNKETCIGGLERDQISGNVSYDPTNHFNMIKKRKKNIQEIANTYIKTTILGKQKGKNLIVTWGSVYGITRSVYDELTNHLDISLICIKHLNPLPNDLKEILNSFERIIIIEENLNQLDLIIRSKFLIQTYSINQVTGKPFVFNELKTNLINICL
ncbi:MAG TPA: 2-oxoacid:acceptor oxidoreductase subunit alpha [Candidatus Azoamicus sp.]